jgi:hypothetical protein
MGFRRMQKAQSKRRSKNKAIQFKDDQAREWKKSNKKFKKYRKISWSEDDSVTEA